MNTRISLALMAALLVGLAGLPANAQDAKVAPKGMKTRGLVSSLGGFTATVNEPVFISGATVELAPGGQTGREEFRVPTYMYIIEGVLTTDYEVGPGGTQGIQYHAAGQSFMDPGGIWHNHMNTTDKPVKYLRVHIGYPGAPTVRQPEPD